MPKFSVDSVETLEYDLSGWGVPDKGIVPEPSKTLVKETVKNVSAVFREATGDDDEADEIDESIEGLTETLRKVKDEEMFSKMEEGLLDALTNLCQGSPSRESLDALPWRPFMAFFGWVWGQITNPEVSAPVTSTTRNPRSGR